MEQSIPGRAGRRAPRLRLGRRSIALRLGHRSIPLRLGHRSIPLRLGHRSIPLRLGHRSIPLRLGHRSIPLRLGHRWSSLRPGHRSISLRADHRPLTLRLGHLLRIALPRRGRRALLAALIALPLLAGAWLWFRQSPFVAVEHVQMSGLAEVRGGDVPQIQAALRGAARSMSTLDVNNAALRSAVASFPLVRSLRTRASFPHELRIDVLEQPPVAQVAVDGVRTALAADGVALGASFLTSDLPVVSIGGLRASSLPAAGHAVRQAQLRQALAALGAAPGPMLPMVQHVYWGPQGLTLALRGGVLAYFGDATRPHAKWLSLVRVLADPSSAGASSVDVRLPERPAAGFPPGVTPPGATAGASESQAAAESASTSELAADVAAALGVGLGGGGSASAGATATPSSGAGSDGASSGGASAGAEPGAGAQASGATETGQGPAASSGAAAESNTAQATAPAPESSVPSEPGG